MVGEVSGDSETLETIISDASILIYYSINATPINYQVHWSITYPLSMWVVYFQSDLIRIAKILTKSIRKRTLVYIHRAFHWNSSLNWISKLIQHYTQDRFMYANWYSIYPCRRMRKNENSEWYQSRELFKNRHCYIALNASNCHFS